MNIDYALVKNIQKLLQEVKSCGAKDCMVAGGAVRDMLLEKPIKDIDVFYTGEISDFTEDEPVEEEQEEKKKEAKVYMETGWEVTSNCTRDYLEYPVQLIKVKEGDLLDHLKTFGVGLSKVAISSEGILLLNEFIQDSFLEDLTFEYGCSKDYMKKIKDKYPNYSAS